MFSFRSDDLDEWANMKTLFDELADFFADFDEISDEVTTTTFELEDLPYSIPTSSFRGFESLHSQFMISTIIEVDVSSVELEPGDEYELTITQSNIGRRANSGKNSHKKRDYKSKMFPKKRPLCDVITSHNDVKIIAELPGVSKEDIKVRVLDGGIANIVARKGNTKYSRKVRLPAAVDTDTGRSKFNNGILEITFDKKKRTKKVRSTN